MANTTVVTYSADDFVVYKYNANMTFVLDGVSTPIDSLYLSSVITDYDFLNNTMPMIFVNLQIDKYLAKKMIDNSDKGTLIFNLQMYIDSESSSKIMVDVIKDTFSYFMTDEVNRYDDTEKQNVGTTVQSTKTYTANDFITTTIGLLSKTHLDNNKKTINGIMQKTTMGAVVYYTLSHMPKLVLEPLKYNKTFTQLILPPMNSVSKTIKYLNNLNAFYDTSYKFFMDFDATYLISSAGTAIKKKNEAIQQIYIEVVNDANKASKIQGMLTDASKGIYYMYVSSGDMQLGTNTMSDKSYSNVTVVDSSGNTTTASLASSGSNSATTKTQLLRVSNGNTGLLNNLTNSLNSTAVQIAISKTGVDTSIFTINKQYHIICKGIYDIDYTGQYILNRAREIYLQKDDNMEVSIMLTFALVNYESSSGVITSSSNSTSSTSTAITNMYTRNSTSTTSDDDEDEDDSTTDGDDDSDDSDTLTEAKKYTDDSLTWHDSDET